MAVTLGDLAERFNGKVRGRRDLVIKGVAPLQSAGPAEIAYVADKKHLKLLERTGAAAVILREADAERYRGPALIVDEPHLCFARIAALLNPNAPVISGIHPTSVVDASAQVAAGAWIGPHCVIDAQAQIGDHVFVGPGCYIGQAVRVGAYSRLVASVVVAQGCIVGSHCILHPGAVIGSDGFGYARDGERWIKVPQLGRVVIGNDVEIGANTTVDRGTLDDTIISDGVKLDNQIQIAHNVRIGENTAIAGCVGVAGSAVIGRRCTIGGQAGIVGHLEITDDVHITAASLVTRSVTEPGVYSSSIRVEPVERWRRNAVRISQLDRMARRLEQLEEEIKRLTKERRS